VEGKTRRFSEIIIRAKTFKSNEYILLRKHLMYYGQESTCSITIHFQPKDITNIPIQIHSDVPLVHFIDTSKPYQSFSCDAEVPSNLSEVKYTVAIQNRKTSKQPSSDQITYSNSGSKIKVASEYFREHDSSHFQFMCVVEDAKTGGLRSRGTAIKVYTVV